MVLAQIFGLGPFGGVRGPGPSPPPARAGGRTRSRTRRVRPPACAARSVRGRMGHQRLGGAPLAGGGAMEWSRRGTEAPIALVAYRNCLVYT